METQVKSTLRDKKESEVLNLVHRLDDEDQVWMNELFSPEDRLLAARAALSFRDRMIKHLRVMLGHAKARLFLIEENQQTAYMVEGPNGTTIVMDKDKVKNHVKAVSDFLSLTPEHFTVKEVKICIDLINQLSDEGRGFI